MLGWFKKPKKFSGVKVMFVERDDLHTRVRIALRSLLDHHPGTQKVCLEFKIYNEQGTLEKRWASKHDAMEEVLLDSTKFRPEFKNPKTFHLPIPFSGTLSIEQRLIFENGKGLYPDPRITEKGIMVEHYSKEKSG